jgi:hypothetical protein
MAKEKGDFENFKVTSPPRSLIDFQKAKATVLMMYGTCKFFQWRRRRATLKILKSRE